MDLPLPPAADLLSCGLALAAGTRTKSLLPLASALAELVLLRRGPELLVSYYRVDGAPEVAVLDRPVPLRAFLDRAARAADRAAALDSAPRSRELTLRLAERARQATIEEQLPTREPIHKRGGAVDAPRSAVPLAFGFEAAIVPVADPGRQATAHSDVHALLFPGGLWLFARGRRIPLLKGPIMLAVSRMVTATRALIEAWEAGRAANVRLRAGTFLVGIRLSRRGPSPVQLTLGSDETGKVTVPELEVAEAALPILRLASDVLRALVSADRSQARNLRVTTLQKEVRALRRRVREPLPRADSIEHDDPERLRAASGASASPSVAVSTASPSPSSLRFDVRWEADIDGLDAASTFLCGDRLVVATPKQTVALGRDDATVLWAHDQPAAASFMAGTVLVRLASDGALALINVEDGEPFCETQIAPRLSGPPCGILAGGRSAPPVAVLAEGRDRLVAVDLRTGELRWRFTARGARTFSLRKAGRILLVATGDSSLSALDVSNGELLWRFACDGGQLSLPPDVSGDVVLTVEGDESGVLHGVDLFSGRALWSRPLGDGSVGLPVAAAGLGILSLGDPRNGELAAFDARCGTPRWRVADPGMGVGGSCLALDRSLIVNTPSGRVTALSLESGRTRWERALAHPVADDVPRGLEPVLRGGALFVPSAAVHVLRPSDGHSIGEPLPCELVPDWTRVDERGWVYVAEESGSLAALAPRPHLSLVR